MEFVERLGPVAGSENQDLWWIIATLWNAAVEQSSQLDTTNAGVCFTHADLLLACAAIFDLQQNVALADQGSL